MKNKFSIVISLFFLGIASSALAFTPATTTQVPWPPSPIRGTILTPTTEFHVFISYVYEWGISLGGIVVFAMFLWAGIQYLTSAGDPSKMGAAIKKIQSSILGLVLLLTSWLILNTINPQLVSLKPLPRLWAIEILPKFDLDLKKMQAPPCNFVVVWPEERFGGKPIKPIKFDREIHREVAQLVGDDGQEVVLEGNLIVPDPDKNEVQRIIGREALDQYSKPWASAKGFIRLTEDELKMIDGKRVSIQRYNDQGEEDPAGLFKEGGLCMIDLFHTTRRWFSVDACGGRLARVQLPSRDLSESKFRDEPITCAEIIRSIPE